MRTILTVMGIGNDQSYCQERELHVFEPCKNSGDGEGIHGSPVALEFLCAFLAGKTGVYPMNC
jgi:hypothetical protein